MSETWYPVIDLNKCSACEICINFCRQGVYEKKPGKPRVVKPGGCVHGCRGCQKKCPSGAIEYAGDTEQVISPSCCS